MQKHWRFIARILSVSFSSVKKWISFIDLINPTKRCKEPVILHEWNS